MKCTEWHQNHCLSHMSREILIPQSCHHAVDICAEETSCSTVKLLSKNLPPSFILLAARSKALRSRRLKIKEVFQLGGRQSGYFLTCTSLGALDP